MASTTGIAVGCAVGVPCFLAICVALYFFLKTKKRLEQEDLEFQKDHDIHNVNQDLDFDNLDQLKKEGHSPTTAAHAFDHSDTSDDGKVGSEKSEERTVSSPTQDGKKGRYIPAYRKKMKSSMTNLSNSRSSSFSNLQPLVAGQQQSQTQLTGSNSSINSSKTNLTDHFYQNVPVLDNNNDNQIDSAANSIDLARSLQLPTPSYGKKPNTNSNNRTSSASSIADEEYDLKNNYNLQNQDEIQEEDQYENEFTNYSENKRAFIEGLRPKREQ